MTPKKAAALAMGAITVGVMIILLFVYALWTSVGYVLLWIHAPQENIFWVQFLLTIIIGGGVTALIFRYMD